jgi:hypothetical protein
MVILTFLSKKKKRKKKNGSTHYLVCGVASDCPFHNTFLSLYIKLQKRRMEEKGKEGKRGKGRIFRERNRRKEERK